MNTLYFDNIVFDLQKSGGISVVWYELLTRICHQNDFCIRFIDNEGSRNFDIVITGHNESPESIFVDNALTDDSYAIITNEMRNNNIFKDGISQKVALLAEI